MTWTRRPSGRRQATGAASSRPPRKLASNAFGRIDRGLIAQQLSERPELAALRGPFRALYAQDFRVICPDFEIPVHSGVYQGCAAAPWLFTIGLAAVLEKVQVPNHVRVVTVVDDVAVSGMHAVEVMRTVRMVGDAMKEAGLPLNDDKTAILSPEVSRRTCTEATYLGVTVSTNSDVQLAAMEHPLPKRLAERMTALTKLVEAKVRPPAQTLGLLLRYVLCSAQYYFETSRRVVAKQWAARMEEWRSRASSGNRCQEPWPASFLCRQQSAASALLLTPGSLCCHCVSVASPPRQTTTTTNMKPLS